MEGLPLRLRGGGEAVDRGRTRHEPAGLDLRRVRPARQGRGARFSPRPAGIVHITLRHVPIVERLVERICERKHTIHILHVGHVPIVERLVEGPCVIKHT